MSSVGMAAGLLIVSMMFVMSKALQKGPTGLTFAFQNSGSIMPPMLLAIIFQSPFGFTLTSGNMIGMACVVAGLFFSAWKSKTPGQNLNTRWFSLTIYTFIAQASILTLFQWRCLFMQEGYPPHPLVPFSCRPEEDVWFMPSIFFVALLIQGLYFFFTERRWFSQFEVIAACFGGLFNGLSTFFLLKATYLAGPSEKAMLFPLFTVLVIVFCNISGRLFYKEAISWASTALLAVGILIGLFL